MRTMTTTPARPAERGSIVIAASVVMMLVLIGAALIARTRVSLDAVATETDTVLADAYADRGVAEVLARIDGGERAAFSGSVETELGSYRYEVEPIDDETFFARSEGEIDGVVRAVEVTIGGSNEAYTLAVDESARISNTTGTISGRVVTNGTISASGPIVGDVVDLYGPRASCTGCAPGTRFDETIDLPFPTSPTGTTRRCPTNGRFLGVLDGQGGTPYVCRRSDLWTSRVRFVGTVEVVNPPLVVHIQTGLDVDFLNASVNAAGATEDFQLIGEGDDNYWWFDSWNSKVNGVLYAPGRDSWLSSSSITGQLTVGVLYIASPNDVWIAPSADLLGATSSGWSVTAFERVPSR